MGKVIEVPELTLLLSSAKKVGISIDVVSYNGFLEKLAPLEKAMTSGD